MTGPEDAEKVDKEKGPTYQIEPGGVLVFEQPGFAGSVPVTVLGVISPEELRRIGRREAIHIGYCPSPS